MLQLLSSHATQEFRYYGGTTQVDFISADGEPLTVEEDKITSVSEYIICLSICWMGCLVYVLKFTLTHQLKSRTDYLLNGEPEQFPIIDFTPHDSKFGFEIGKACFCNE